MRQSLRRGGRCVFVCWRAPRDNAWAMTPLMARASIEHHAAADGPERSGPFAFADEQRLRSILQRRFAGIDVRRFDADVCLATPPPPPPKDRCASARPSRLLREAGEQHRRDSRCSRTSARPVCAGRGAVHLNARPGSCRHRARAEPRPRLNFARRAGGFMNPVAYEPIRPNITKVDVNGGVVKVS
jgi:hypothetical protein